MDNQEKWLQIFNEFHKPYWIMDKMGFIKWGNKDFKQKFGDKSEGENIYDWIKLLDINDLSFKLELEEKLSSHFPFSMTLPLQSEGRQLYWTELTTTNIEVEEESYCLVAAKDINHWKRKEARLERNESMLEKTGEIAKIGGWEFYPLSGKILWSKQVYVMHELLPETELTYELAISFFPSPDRERLEHAIHIALTEHKPYNLELAFSTPSGKKMFVHAMGAPTVVNGITVKLSGTIQDITEKRQIQEEIRNREEKLMKLTQNVPGAIYELLLTPDGKMSFPFLSKGVKQLYHWLDLDEIKDDATKTFDHIHPDDLPRLEEAIQYSYQNLTNFKEQWRVIYEGKIVWMEATSAPEKRSDGTVVWYGIFRDITEQKLAESQLLLLNSVVEYTKDAIWITKAESTCKSSGGSEIIYVNKAFSEITGYSRDESIGKTSSILQGPRSNPEILQEISNAMENCSSCDIEIINYKKDGSEYWSNTVVSPVEDEEGSCINWVSIQRDISEKKREELELIKAKEEAERASVAKSEFLSTMSHEIRTPLNAIIGMTGLLSETNLNEEQEGFLKTIRQGGENLLSVINDILDYSKIESGKLDLENIEFEVLEPIEDTLELLSNKAHEKNIELLYLADEAVPQVAKGDVTRIRQILVNLVGNAIKFTEKGEVLVTVASQKIDDESTQLQFSIKDSGIGIPKNKLDRLFKSFSQVDASTTRAHGGSGLGLAICKKLVEMHGGNIWVESEPRIGSTFYFTIMVENGTTYKPLFTEELYKLNNKKICFIDDNATNRKIIRKQLTSLGVDYFDFSSPSELLNQIQKLPIFDLFILDMHMPEMDGLELGKIIRKSRIYAEKPLILLSSGIGIQTQEQKEIFDLILQKPLRKKDLYRSLNRLFDKDYLLDKQLAFQNKSKVKSTLDLSNFYILLAEDNKVNQQVAKKMLQKFHANFEVANNGLEAIDFLKMRKFDLILMDLHMPEMDGLEATSSIRSLPNIIQPIILAMTANASKEIREQCIRAGMNDYLPKPVKLNVLRTVLKEWLIDSKQKV